MSFDEGKRLLDLLDAWVQQYQAARTRLTLAELHALQTRISHLAQQIERDSKGPDSSPVVLPDE